MRINYKERHRRIREAQISAWTESYNVERDPGLRDAFADLPRSAIKLLCCPLAKDVNQGGILRLAEAYRIEEVVFSPEEDDAEDFAGHRGTKIWQPHRWEAVDLALPKESAAGAFTVALTLSEKAVSLSRVPWRFPLALVVGEEKFGIPPDVEEACDASAAIPLYGMVQSLNVTTAVAIALHEATAAYVRENPGFEPARNASRRLLGLQELDYGARCRAP